MYRLLRTGERIKGEGKTPKTSKNTSQRRKTQGPGKGLEEAKTDRPNTQESGCGREFKAQTKER